MLHSWKFAANAVWEQAFLVDARQSIDYAAVENWVISQPQNVALEAIFAENDVPGTMFGVRLTGLSKFEQASRIARLLSKTAAIESESDFRIEASRIFPEFALFSSELRALNIGIVSQWYSFGPETIWTPGGGRPLSSDELRKKAPRFFEPTHNPAAIEFWYTHPTDHWYKIYVSDASINGYVIDPARYDLAAGRLKDFEKASDVVQS